MNRCSRLSAMLLLTLVQANPCAAAELNVAYGEDEAQRLDLYAPTAATARSTNFSATRKTRK